MVLGFHPGDAFITLTGFPTVAGTYVFDLLATDSYGNTLSKSYSICVVDIIPAVLTVATLGPYTQTLVTSCGLADSWTITSGALPSGLSLDSTSGTISGIATEIGDFPITVEVAIGSLRCSRSYTLTVSGAGFKICNWPAVLATISGLDGFSLCDLSAYPEWNGIFDLEIDGTGFYAGGKFWYFVNQSINGRRVSANEAPDYPNPDWQNNDFYTSLLYITGTWTLQIFCNNGQVAWAGTLTNLNPNDASGTYTVSGPATPATIKVILASQNCGGLLGEGSGEQMEGEGGGESMIGEGD